MSEINSLPLYFARIRHIKPKKRHFETLNKITNPLKAFNNIALKSLNTFGFDVIARQYFCISSKLELADLFKTNKLNPKNNHITLPIGILGGGSNITFTQNFKGCILHNKIKGLELIEDCPNHVILKVGSGENWHETVLYTLSQNWGGIENLSLIPGSVGAAPIQNIGAYGVELKDSFYSLEAFHLESGEFHTFTNLECKFGYRDSVFKNQLKGQYFIVSVKLKLSKSPEIKTQYGDIQTTLNAWGINHPNIQDISKAVIYIRQSKLPDPAEIGNCGSFFKNPIVPNSIIPNLQKLYPDLKIYPAAEGFSKVPAGWLIEKAGWKGYIRGKVGVHSKQALVLVNFGGGNGKEIIQLARDIQNDIMVKFGIALEMEVDAW